MSKEEDKTVPLDEPGFLEAQAKRKKALDDMRQAGVELEQAMKEYKTENDMWWNGLSEEEREKAFFAVVSRIHQAEVEERRSYRGSLYSVFGFQPSMYAMGMECGYFAIHNMLFDCLEYDAMKNVNRFEVIDSNGRSYTKYLDKDEIIKYNLQDDDKTLKVFIDKLT